MTICISAITCNKDKEEAIVFSTDHMISVGDLGQFEKEIKKYKPINKNMFAMLSGQTLLFDRCLEGTSAFHDFFKVREKIHENLLKVRKDIISKEVHESFGINEDFVKELLKNQVPNQFVQNVLQTISEFNLKTSILLIGFDGNNNAQISEINEWGYSEYRDINFHAIGSGSIQALNTLLFQRHSKNNDLKTTVYNVYKAKRNAEVANGVGKETELLILIKDRPPITLKHPQMEVLKNIYEEELTFGANHKNLNRLNLSF